MLAEARRTPDPENDGTANWSLMTLCRALAPDGLSHVSIYTIGQVLHASSYRWLASRTWCETGRAVRKRRHGSGHGPECRSQKNLIERAYREGERLGLAM